MNKQAKAIEQQYNDILANYHPKWRERPCEYAFLFHHLNKLRGIKSVLDVGSGTTHLPEYLGTCGIDVTAIDKVANNPYWNVIEHDITQPVSVGLATYDLISCISVLEHIPKWKDAVTNMMALLNPKGYLVLTFPYSEQTYHPNIYKHKQAGYGKNVNFICQVFSRNEINEMTQDNAEIIGQEYWQIFTGEMWTFGARISPPQKVNADELHHLTCVLIQKKETIE